MGGLDFNDLVWTAVDLLEHHPDLCARLGRRWPIVLEDEAQDSVPLQEDLLTLLGGGRGNWIRVGDPNQAIMSTLRLPIRAICAAFWIAKMCRP